MPKNLSIYFLTYNVNGKSPANLNELFEFETNKNIDIYVISLQELPYTALVADYWRKGLENVLSSKGFVLLEIETMSITSLMIFVPKKRIMDFYKVDKTYANVDFFYRKGAIGIRFFWKNLTFCMIGSHFTPHDHNYHRRNENYHHVLNNIRFNSKDTILSHDFVFWLGDLNYRINTINANTIKEYISIAQNYSGKDRFKNLLAYDQLNYAKGTRMAFSEFNEDLITFPPTYKFIIDSNQYNEHRKPAYTDRILYRNAFSEDCANFIDLKNYSSIPSFTISDHKPVRLVATILENAEVSKILALSNGKSGSRKFKRSIYPSSVKISPKETTSLASSSFSSNSIDEFKSQELEKQNKQKQETENLEEVFYEKIRPQEFEESDIQQPVLLSEESFEQELLQPDQGTAISRNIRINFEPITDWVENSPQRIRFRIIDSRTGDSIQPYPELFRSVLSEWDYIGLLREDWLERNEYISYVLPDFNFIEEAREADALDGDDFDESAVDNPRSSTSSAAATVSSSSSSYDPTIVHRQGKSKEKSNEEFNDGHHEEYSYTANFSNESTILAPPGRYQLLYYRSNGDVLGISDPFEISRNEQLHDFPQ